MSKPNDTSTRTAVAIRHAPTAIPSAKPRYSAELIAKNFFRWAKRMWGEEMPPAWRPILAGFPEHLQEIGLSYSSVVKILPLTLRFIKFLAKPPEQIGKADLETAMTKERSSAGAFSYLCLYMAAQGHWPKSFLRQRAQVGAIEKYLAPGWRTLLSQLERDLGDLNVPYHAQHYFRRCATIFLWWSDLPSSGVLDEARFRTAWEKFWRDRPDAAGGIFPKISWNPERCYAAIWNCLLKTGRVQGAPLKFVLAAPPFWRTISEPVRGAAHRLLGSGERHDDSEIRRRRLLYALTMLGFCAHGDQRAIEVLPEEWGRLEETLRREGFLDVGREEVLDDVREVLALIDRGASAKERILK